MEPEPRKERRGSLLAVSALAAVVTAATGLIVETLTDGRRVQAHEEQADDEARDRMLSLGWGPLVSPVRVGSVEIMRAREGFELPLGHGVISGTSATTEQLEQATRWVREELGRYPTATLAGAQLRRVVLCGELREDRQTIPSLPNYNRTLLLDAHAEESYLRRLIHHEIFHFIDLADDGSVLRDVAWTKLNPSGFSYGHGGRTMRGSAASVAPPPDGFVSGYATSALEEDKAEVFAEMMWAPEALRQRSEADPVLRAKMERIRAITPELFGSHDP
jgi:hypothetical protein